MILSRFKDVLTDSVVYLYPNLVISNEITFPEQEYVVLNEDGSLSVKGDIHAVNGFKITRDQAFLPNDRDLIKIFLKEIDDIESFSNMNPEYVTVLRNTALNKAIATTLTSRSAQILSKVIDAMTRLGDRTYEGKSISFGVIINDILKCKNRVNNIFFPDFIEENYAAVLTNGTESFIEIDSDGYILRYLQLNSSKSDLGLAPYDHTRILEYCGKDTIGVVLSKKSELLIFHENELKYTKRGGRWNPYSHKEMIKSIYNRSENDNLLFSKAVYLTALDLSFGTSGGIISFLDENEVQQALTHINIRDIVNEKYFNIKREAMKNENDHEYEKIKDVEYNDFLRLKENAKSCVLNRIIAGRKFFQLYRKLRQELVAIDGATVIDYNGDIVAVGAIIKIEAGSKGGGRVAAARTLSHYGIAIEISSDASIRGFALDQNGEPETIFDIADQHKERLI